MQIPRVLAAMAVVLITATTIQAFPADAAPAAPLPPPQTDAGPEIPPAGGFDPCSQPITATVTDDEAVITCYYFDSNQSDCRPFNTTTCGDQDNNFSTKENCAEYCMSTRNARRIPQDISYKMLSDFEWSAPAIGTNVARRRFPIAFCDLERDMGILCNGIRRGSYLEQFYYEPRTNRCNSFIYNGCAGNANRFATIWECTQSCVRKSIQHF